MSLIGWGAGEGRAFWWARVSCRACERRAGWWTVVGDVGRWRVGKGWRGLSAAVGGGGAVEVQAGGGPVVEEVQLLTEVVEREADHIEEVSVDVLHQHPTQRLDTITSSFVPDTHN